MEGTVPRSNTEPSGEPHLYSASPGVAPPPYSPTPDTRTPYNPDARQSNKHGNSKQYSEKGNTGPPPTVVVTKPDETPTVQHRDLFNAALSAMAFFFIPTGIVASVFAYKANKRYKTGDYVNAARFNRYALILIVVSIVLGVICYIIIIAVKINYASYTSV